MQRNIPAQALILCHQIRDWHPNIKHISTFLEYLCLHFPDGRLVPALEWLIANKLTGEKFVNFTAQNCKGSQLELFRYLTMRIKKEKKTYQLHAKEMIL